MNDDHTPAEAGTDPRVDILAAWRWGAAWRTAGPAVARSQRNMTGDLLARLDAVRPSVVPGDTATEDEGVRERFAAVMHETWAHWMRYLLGTKAKAFSNGAVVLDAEDVARWRRQIDTPYAELSEAEKASDIEQVDRFAAAGLLAPAGTEGEAEYERGYAEGKRARTTPPSLHALHEALREISHEATEDVAQALNAEFESMGLGNTMGAENHVLRRLAAAAVRALAAAGTEGEAGRPLVVGRRCCVRCSPGEQHGAWCECLNCVYGEE